jgi:nitrite reductase/ring-hydroxylating ferredoxin subunit
LDASVDARSAGDATPEAPTATLVEVGRESDFEHAVPRIFTIAGKEVGVVRWGERFFAMRNHCPDQGGPLCAGPVRLPFAADPSGEHVDLSFQEGRPVIACPWHHYEFDLQTGHEVRGGRRAVMYKVEVTGGKVYVRRARPAS